MTPYELAQCVEHAYDARDRPTSFTRTGASSQYSYDANSNRLSSTDVITSSTDLGQLSASLHPRDDLALRLDLARVVAVEELVRLGTNICV